MAKMVRQSQEYYNSIALEDDIKQGNTSFVDENGVVKSKVGSKEKTLPDQPPKRIKKARESLKDKKLRKALEKQCSLQVRPNTVSMEISRAGSRKNKSVTRIMRFVPQTTMQIKAYELSLKGTGEVADGSIISQEARHSQGGESSNSRPSAILTQKKKLFNSKTKSFNARMTSLDWKASKGHNAT